MSYKIVKTIILVLSELRHLCALSLSISSEHVSTHVSLLYSGGHPFEGADSCPGQLVLGPAVPGDNWSGGTAGPPIRHRNVEFSNCVTHSRPAIVIKFFVVLRVCMQKARVDIDKTGSTLW